MVCRHHETESKLKSQTPFTVNYYSIKKTQECKVYSLTFELKHALKNLTFSCEYYDLCRNSKNMLLFISFPRLVGAEM